jgi:biotin operon repressor
MDWASVAQIAQQEGVSKASVSRRVKAMIAEHGLSVERDERGYVSSVCIKEYAEIRRRYDNSSAARAPNRDLYRLPPIQGDVSQSATPNATSGATLAASHVMPIVGDDTYDEAQRQKAWHDAERKRIELEEIKGRLVDVRLVIDGYARAATCIMSVMQRLEDYADDWAAAVAKEGVHGLRVAVKASATQLLADMARGLRTEADDLEKGILKD